MMKGMLNSFLNATCLKTRYSLRRQLVVGYGMVAFMTILLAVVLATVAAVVSKGIVERESQDFLVQQRVVAFMTENAFQVSELLERRMQTSWRGTAALLTELIQDRYYYLHKDGDDGDSYPLKAQRMPLPDPQNISSNWNSRATLQENALLGRFYDEQVDNSPFSSGSTFTTTTAYSTHPEQRRRQVFEPFMGKWSTESAMCWKCPQLDDDDNTNDAASKNQQQQIMADIGMLLKPIWETEPAAFQIRVGFFPNGGTIMFPAFNFANFLEQTYQSQGCAWMVQDFNPYTQQHYGTREDVKECSPSGFQVPLQNYNLMEQDYCQDQIAHPFETRLYGPRFDPITNHWVFTVGQALFDPTTGDFLACAGIDLSMDLLLDGLLTRQHSSRRTQVAIVRPSGTRVEVSRFEEGGEDEQEDVASGSAGNANTQPPFEEIEHIINTGFMDETMWKKIIEKQWGFLLPQPDTTGNSGDDDDADKKGRIAEWSPETVMKRLYMTHEDPKGRIFAAVPSPLPPDSYDPLYRPEFFVIESAKGEELFDVLDDIGTAIEDDTLYLIAMSISLGVAGLTIFLTIVWLVAKILTRPLSYMEYISWKIVNHSTQTNTAFPHQQFSNRLNAHADDDDTADRKKADDKNDGGDTLVEEYMESKSPLLPCTPQTEISKLVWEFQDMIRGFSGTGASQVALPSLAEIANCVTWKQPFGRLYELTMNAKEELKKEQRNSFNKLSESMNKLDDSFVVDPSVQNGHEQPPQPPKVADNLSKRRRSSLLRSSIVSLIREDLGDLSDDDEDGNRHSRSKRGGDDHKEDDNRGRNGAAPAPRNRRQSLLRSSVVSLSPMDFLKDDISRIEEEDEETSGMFRSALMMEGASASAYFAGRVGSSAMFRVGGVTRTNLGPNSLLTENRFGDQSERGDKMEELLKISRSSLFRWILGCIALPLLLTIAVMCTIVAIELLNSFPTLVQKGENLAFDLGIESIRNTATLLALQAEEAQLGSLRDLFVLTRGAGWLLFGGIGRGTDIFEDTEIAMVEECKTIPPEQQCPFQIDDTRSPCDCDWNDPWKRECKPFPDGSRHLQRPFYMNQARDFDNVTGYRLESVSFPDFDSSPETTLWWTNVSAMPGAYKGENASGYATTYDRLRVIASLSAISMPVYNYNMRDRFIPNHWSMSSYVAFESDGGYWGYSGCSDDSVRYAHWESSALNSAFMVRPELCPIGKFGYDPRCRSWYDNTKKNALEREEGIHVTGPYIFATVEDVGITAGSPLIDPKTGEFVAVTAIDVPLDGILPEDAPQTESNFFFVLSPDTFSEEDTILGPDFPFGSSPKRIGELILPSDKEGSDNRRIFDAIAEKMKQGELSETSFRRTTASGNQEELQISYAPVYARVLTPVSPDDYTRGADVERVLLYSIAVVGTVESLRSPFEVVENGIAEKLESVVAVYLSAIAIVTFFCILFAAKISLAVTKPMLILLRIVQRVNSGRIDDDLAPMSGGSREVNQVYTSFAKLYKIVRMANSSYFAGNFKWAHHIALDALRLFRKIKDEKAIAIACNNAGNTLFALSMQSRVKGSCELVDGLCCIRCAIERFNEAIEIGQRQFDNGQSDDVKAMFAQQLADRHFNRAICLLHSLDDPCVPENAREVAYTDIIRCRDYDLGVHEYFMHAKLMFKKSDVMFERSLRRLHGLASLFSIDNAVWQFWDVNELIDSADVMLQAAWTADDAPLFRTATRVGRLQQLEGAVIDLEVASGKVEEAATLSMRMLIEDEFILETSFAFAADSLLQLMREANRTESPWPKAAITGTRYEFQRMRKLGKRTTLDIGRCFIFCIELAKSTTDGATRSLINQECLAFYDEHCSDKDVVGLVGLSNSVDSNLIVKLGSKESEVVQQRDGIMKAIRERARSTSYPALPTAVNMIIDTARSNAQDAVLVYVTDGSVWDPHSFSVMERKIHEANERRTSNIDIITIGVGVQEGDDFAAHCHNLCLAARSRQSKFYCSTVDELEETFDSAGSVISARASASNSRILLGTTMEKF